MLGVIAPTVRCAVVPDPIVPVVAVVQARPAAARTVQAVWDAGEAACVLDPGAPAAVRAQVLEAVRPTHLVDDDGRQARPDGIGTSEGVAAIVTTSGTTATPKAVELTTAGMATIGAGFASALDIGGDDRWLVCLPLHHVAGLAILARARTTGTPVTVHAGFDLAAVASSARAADGGGGGVTVVSLVPTMLHRMLDAGAPIDRFRWIVTGGASTPPALRRRTEDAGGRPVDTYGLSETWAGVLLDGRPIDGVEAVVVDDEILVRGDPVMRGYRLDPHATDAALVDLPGPDGQGPDRGDGRWFRTGDVGTQDASGRITVVDRKRDLVVTGGVNVSPTAVESVLATHPAVADIAVAGAPDPEWGERVVAYVVPGDARAPTLEDLRAFGRDRLSGPQLPRAVVLIPEIPRTPGGKVRRHELAPDPPEPAI